MSASSKKSDVPTQPPGVPEPIPFAKFLAETPPDSEAEVFDIAEHDSKLGGFAVARPNIELPCPSEKCAAKGAMTYSHVGAVPKIDQNVGKYFFLGYECCNCSESTIRFAILGFNYRTSYNGRARKIGQNPPYGDNVPSKVFSLIGPDRELFLKGRRSENRGLGIGAFVYYRRVVENQRDRIIKEMRRVAERSGYDAKQLAVFDEALKETRFAESVKLVSPAIPRSLYIAGENPLTLLFKALSIGVHKETDDECLQSAHEVRALLSALAERMTALLKDDEELEAAVKRLTAKREEAAMRDL